MQANPITSNDPTGLIDSSHKGVAPPLPSITLKPVILVSHIVKKSIPDNTKVVLKIPSLTLPKPIGPGGNSFWGDGNGNGSTASISDGGDKQPEEFGLLLDNIGMYSSLNYPRPELKDPLYYYEKIHTLIELMNSKKRRKRIKNIRMQR